MIITKNIKQNLIALGIALVVFVVKIFVPLPIIAPSIKAGYWITDIMNLVLSLLPLIIVLYLLKYLKKKLG